MADVVSAYTAFPGRFEPVAGTDRYTASEDLAWDIGRVGSGYPITVPALYEHDVSVPWYLTWAFSRHDPRYQRAARLHDWLLDCGWSAWTSSAIFFEALKADDVSRIRRWAMAQSVLGYISRRDAERSRQAAIDDALRRSGRPMTTGAGGFGLTPPKPTR